MEWEFVPIYALLAYSCKTPPKSANPSALLASLNPLLATVCLDALVIPKHLVTMESATIGA